MLKIIANNYLLFCEYSLGFILNQCGNYLIKNGEVRQKAEQVHLVFCQANALDLLVQSL